MAEAFGIACHELVSLNFRCGSTTDYKHPLILRPLLEVKQTKTGAKQTLALEGRLSGVSGRTPSFSTGGALLAVSLYGSALIPALETAGAME